MNSRTLFKELVSSVTTDEGQDEIHSIIYRLLEKFANVSRSDVLSEKRKELSPEEEQKLNAAVQRINSHEPVQYIIGECEFMGRRFIVNESVLIPRPETEELVNHILSSVDRNRRLRVLDIGTGSGCIPITLALEIPDTEIMATDISITALRTAEENARHLNANVTFIQHDILKEELPFSDLDVVISNPPYVTEDEKPFIRKNVLDYEPHEALFVPKDDPLIFFKIIISRAKAKMKAGGMIFFEIHEEMGTEMEELMKGTGLTNVEISKDMSGHDRLARGFFVG